MHIQIVPENKTILYPAELSHVYVKHLGCPMLRHFDQKYETLCHAQAQISKVPSSNPEV